MTIPARPARTDLIDTVIRDTGIDGAMINHLVATFYDRVRRDPILGPIFEARVSDWDVHLGAMSRFWASVVLMSGTYHGEPMRRHLPLPIGGAHFDRWLELFRDTACAVCPEPAAAVFIDRAERIARSLEMGIGVSRGQLLRQGERLSCPAGD